MRYLFNRKLCHSGGPFFFLLLAFNHTSAQENGAAENKADENNKSARASQDQDQNQNANEIRRCRIVRYFLPRLSPCNATFWNWNRALRLPTAGHIVDVLVSKDFGKQHFDFNEGVRFLGRPAVGGYDRTYFTAFD